MPLETVHSPSIHYGLLQILFGKLHPSMMTPRPSMTDPDHSTRFGLLQTLFGDLHPFNLLQQLLSVLFFYFYGSTFCNFPNMIILLPSHSVNEFVGFDIWRRKLG